MRPGELLGRGADVHVGVVKHEVVEVDQLAVEPQAGRGIGEVGARDPPLADRAFGEPLIEAGERSPRRRRAGRRVLPTAADRGTGCLVAKP